MDRPFGIYVHVPFCRTRCGYCDFNTYTASELGSGASAVGPTTYAKLAVEELRAARQALGARPRAHGVLRRRNTHAAAAE